MMFEHKFGKTIAIKQFFNSKKNVFCVIGYETIFWIFPEILFYDYIYDFFKNPLYMTFSLKFNKPC